MPSKAHDCTRANIKKSSLLPRYHYTTKQDTSLWASTGPRVNLDKIIHTPHKSKEPCGEITPHGPTTSPSTPSINFSLHPMRAQSVPTTIKNFMKTLHTLTRPRRHHPPLHTQNHCQDTQYPRKILPELRNVLKRKQFRFLVSPPTTFPSIAQIVTRFVTYGQHSTPKKNRHAIETWRSRFNDTRPIRSAKRMSDEV